MMRGGVSAVPPLEKEDWQDDQGLTGNKGRMAKTVESLDADLRTVRTGRASPALIERVSVDYYGSPTP